ncbi:MAG TPA: HPr(Ser) kinase/phosphatase [Pyrinomonadaceae bacterium]|jgi:HPr kinase/phosphorylase|nr:HPr(Ser) kinase/phosphatase [Pyrinomonadaceae bacterium]
MSPENLPNARMPQISVAEFVERARNRLEIVILNRTALPEGGILDSPRVQKLGLALSGFVGTTHRGRIQIYGNSERAFLSRLGENETQKALQRLQPENITCILVSAGRDINPRLLEFADTNRIPVLSTPLPSSEAIKACTQILEVALAPRATVHGVLINVYGIGVLLTGESGVGKSECALDLIGRGHRLIADDAVVFKKVGDKLIGEPSPVTRDHIEIRGLGIINVRELFGVSALAPTTHVRFCIEFVSESSAEIERLEPLAEFLEVLGTQVEKFVIPVRPGRNLATLVETAVRLFVSRLGGDKTLSELVQRHENELQKRAAFKRGSLPE